MVAIVARPYRHLRAKSRGFPGTFVAKFATSCTKSRRLGRGDAPEKWGDSALLSVHNPSSIDEMSEPEPDVALLKPRSDFYTEKHPTPTDVLLLIEVGHTTVHFDRKVKAPLYAEAGIPEYWILNIPKNVLEVRSDPVDGEYMRYEILRHGDTVSPRSFPGVSFAVDEILG